MGKKKVSSAGRYGARYGLGIRKRIIKIEDKQKLQEPCPRCGFRKVKRTAAGIFLCKKCNAKFAGGAYFPSTLTGKIVGKMISQKSFSAGLAELEAAKESAAEKDIAIPAPEKKRQESAKRREEE